MDLLTEEGFGFVIKQRIPSYKTKQQTIDFSKKDMENGMNILDENSKRIISRIVCMKKPTKKGFLFNPTFSRNGNLLYLYEESDKNLIERIKKSIAIAENVYSKYRHMWE